MNAAEAQEGLIGMVDEKSQPILRLQGVSRRYRSRGSLFRGPGKEIMALNRISLEIREGEIFGLVGQSGSGKTTAGRLIVKLEQPDSGSIFLDGQDITRLKGRRLKAFRKAVQMIFQDPYQSLNPQLSILDTVSEPLLVHKIGSAGERRELALQALKSVGLSPPEDFIHRFPHQLSGGQRQRVAIARATVLKPKLVVADEPTSMLDASISAQIFNILREMRDRLQVTLLFITHNLAAARYLCDRIAVIYKGTLVEMGKADEVIRQPSHPYTQALIDALPSFGCDRLTPYDTLLKGERTGVSQAGCVFYPRCKVARRLKCSLEQPDFKETTVTHGVACFYSEEIGQGRPAEADACSYGI
jgi:oligopeptide/dipeptide ABC transporter ATP-binding protein